MLPKWLHTVFIQVISTKLTTKATSTTNILPAVDLIDDIVISAQMVAYPAHISN
jgi:hypothetical protein